MTTRRNILLLFPDFGGSVIFYHILEPLVLEIFSAIAREEGCEPRLIDLRMDKRGHERLAKQGYVPDFIAVTARGYYEIPAVNALLKRCKSLWPNAPIVLGGGQATITPELYTQEYIDILVRGPGERLWRNMCREGVARQDTCRIVQDDAPAKTWSFPLPDRAATEKWRGRYKFYIPQHDGRSFERSSFTFTTQGCPFRCTFCSIWPANLGLYRRRAIPEVIEELKAIKEPHVYLFDDNMLAEPAYAEELADAIQAAGIRKTYTSYSRADHIVEHPELVKKWAAVGLRHLCVGLEAIGGDEELDRLNKVTTLKQNKRALAVLREAGVYCYAHILLTPEMTRKEFDAVYDFIAENKLEYPITPYLTPLPGTKLFEECRAEDKLLTEDPKYFTYVYMVVRPEKLSIRDYYREVDRLYLRMWSWKRYLSGGCGDTSLRAFLQWWLFTRLLILYLRFNRRVFFRDIEQSGRDKITSRTSAGVLH